MTPFRVSMPLRKMMMIQKKSRIRPALLTWSTTNNTHHTERTSSFKKAKTIKTVWSKTAHYLESHNDKASTQNLPIHQSTSHPASTLLTSLPKPLKSLKTGSFLMLWKNIFSRFMPKTSSRNSHLQILIRSLQVNTLRWCPKTNWSCKSSQIDWIILKSLITYFSRASNTSVFFTCWTQNTETATTKTDPSHLYLGDKSHHRLSINAALKKITVNILSRVHQKNL